MTKRSEACLALIRLGTRMAAGFDQRFADAGMTQAQFRLLLAVWQKGGSEGVEPSVLAEYLLIERATVSYFERNLLENGFIARLPGSDRRSHRLILTEKGGAALSQSGAKATELGRETLECFDEAEMETLHDLLMRLDKQLRIMAQRRESGEPTKETK